MFYEEKGLDSLAMFLSVPVAVFGILFIVVAIIALPLYAGWGGFLYALGFSAVIYFKVSEYCGKSSKSSKK